VGDYGSERQSRTRRMRLRNEPIGSLPLIHVVGADNNEVTLALTWGVENVTGNFNAGDSIEGGGGAWTGLVNFNQSGDRLVWGRDAGGSEPTGVESVVNLSQSGTLNLTGVLNSPGWPRFLNDVSPKYLLLPRFFPRFRAFNLANRVEIDRVFMTAPLTIATTNAMDWEIYTDFNGWGMPFHNQRDLETPGLMARTAQMMQRHMGVRSGDLEMFPGKDIGFAENLEFSAYRGARILLDGDKTINPFGTPGTEIIGARVDDGWIVDFGFGNSNGTFTGYDVGGWIKQGAQGLHFQIPAGVVRAEFQAYVSTNWDFASNPDDWMRLSLMRDPFKTPTGWAGAVEDVMQRKTWSDKIDLYSGPVNVKENERYKLRLTTPTGAGTPTTALFEIFGIPRTTFSVRAIEIDPDASLFSENP